MSEDHSSVGSKDEETNDWIINCVESFIVRSSSTACQASTISVNFSGHAKSIGIFTTSSSVVEVGAMSLPPRSDVIADPYVHVRGEGIDWT